MASSSTTGIGFPGMLTILFIGLKITGYIQWSWFWVLSPLWISFLILMAVLCGFAYTYMRSQGVTGRELYEFFRDEIKEYFKKK